MTLDPLLKSVCEFFSRQGVPAYLVGGYVRDSLLGHNSPDVDVAIRGDALAMAQDLALELRGAFVTLDAERGVGRVVIEPLENSSICHIDVSSFEGAIEDDLLKRDFTIDAIAIPLSSVGAANALENIVDHVGGLRDLRLRTLRAVAADVFLQDPGRLVRAVRLSAQLGFDIDESTKALIRRDTSQLSRVAPERVRNELLHILALPEAHRYLREMDSLGLLTKVVPELEAGKGVSQPKEHFWDVFSHNVETVRTVEQVLARDDSANDALAAIPWDPALEGYFAQEMSDGHSAATLLKLAALLHDIAKPQTKTVEANGRIRFLGHHKVGAEIAEEILRRLRISSRGVQFIRTLVEHHLRPSQMNAPGEMPTRKAIYRYYRDLNEAALATLYLNLADYLAARGPNLDKLDWLAHTKIISYVLKEGLHGPASEPLVKLVDGNDLMREFGLSAGQELGRLLEELREAQAAGDVRTRDEALAFVKQRLAEASQRNEGPDHRSKRGEQCEG